MKPNRIKKLRIEVGMSQKELVLSLNVRQSHFSSVENGVYIPKRLDELEDEAIAVLKPLLVQKLIKAQEEVNRLENLIIQYQN